MNNKNDVSYSIDKYDRIVRVGGTWDETARDSGSDRLIADRVTGTNLFSHISGEPTRNFVWTMIDAVRKLQRPCRRRYRCDTPNLKRNMEMTIMPDGNDLVSLEHRLISTEPLSRPLLFRSAEPLDDRKPLRLRCSMCNRVRLGQDWHEPDEQPDLVGKPEPISVIYSICGGCRDVAGQVSLHEY